MKKLIAYLLLLASFSIPYNIGGKIIENKNQISIAQNNIGVKLTKPLIDFNGMEFVILSEHSDYFDLIKNTCDSINTTYTKPSDITALVKYESNFNQYAVSRKGAKGLTQLMDETAAIYNVEDPFDSVGNLIGGVKHCEQLMIKYKGNKIKAFAAYNAGDGNVDKWIKKGWKGKISKIPFKETRNYVNNILNLSKRIEIASNLNWIGWGDFKFYY